jgi:hypothetical protein
MPAGMAESGSSEPLFTPTTATRSGTTEQSYRELVDRSRRWRTQCVWYSATKHASYAAERGIIADTKLEFASSTATDHHRRDADAGLVAILAGGRIPHRAFTAQLRQAVRA